MSARLCELSEQIREAVDAMPSGIPERPLAPPFAVQVWAAFCRDLRSPPEVLQGALVGEGLAAWSYRLAADAGFAGVRRAQVATGVYDAIREGWGTVGQMGGLHRERVPLGGGG